jgi:PadR family transcriptional regulator AphA
MAEGSHHLGTRSPEYALLGFLYLQPRHGYALHRQLGTELGHVWHVSQSQTYSILKRLEIQGWISSTTQVQAKLPARQVLQITQAGRRRFEQWLDAPSSSSVRAIRLEFITRLYFAWKLFPNKLQPILKAQSAEINSTLARLEMSQSTIPPEQAYNRLSLDLRIQQLRALRRWMGKCRRVVVEKGM